MVTNDADDISNYRFMNPQNRKESYMSKIHHQTQSKRRLNKSKKEIRQNAFLQDGRPNTAEVMCSDVNPAFTLTWRNGKSSHWHWQPSFKLSLFHHHVVWPQLSVILVKIPEKLTSTLNLEHTERCLQTDTADQPSVDWTTPVCLCVLHVPVKCLH